MKRNLGRAAWLIVLAVIAGCSSTSEGPRCPACKAPRPGATAGQCQSCGAMIDVERPR